MGSEPSQRRLTKEQSTSLSVRSSFAYVVVTVLAATMVGYSAFSVFSHATWIQSLTDYGVPRSWWPHFSAFPPCIALSHRACSVGHSHDTMMLRNGRM